MGIQENFRAFNFALIYHKKYGFKGAFEEYKRQREELNQIREKLKKMRLRKLEVCNR